MSDTFTHDTFLSPFTWRYGTDPMRKIWSLTHQRQLWRQIWVALAEAQSKVGLVSAEQVEDLRKHQNNIDISRANEFEADLHHDLMAEVHTYAEQCPIGGGIIHLGATSMDIEDNADAMRLQQSTALILESLRALLECLANQIKVHADTVCMAFTHIQPAEPTTIGYRLAFYAQDLLEDYLTLKALHENIRGKGFKGAVGTSASYGQLLEGSAYSHNDIESYVMQALDLPAYDVTHQTYTRRQDWQIVSTLSGIAMTISKFAFDLRIMQSPPIGEWNEPFGKKQIGSSAMPFKRNPIHSENINSLARIVATLPRVLWDDAANSLLERTLDDSGNRRVVLPQAFLVTDEILKRATRLISGLVFNMERIQHNLDVYGAFAATERVLMEATKKGGNRQELHEVIRQHSLVAWQAIQKGNPNPLRDNIVSEKAITTYLQPDEIQELLQADTYVGDAPNRARMLVEKIFKMV